MAERTTSREIVVYTALYGDYESLIEQPIRDKSECRFVCFTDNPALDSKTWDIQLSDPTLPWDPTRAARQAKIKGYQRFPDAEASVWIDNRIVLRKTPEELVSRYLADSDISLPLHSFRRSVREEFAEVIAAGFDTPSRVREQMHFMQLHAPETLEQTPYWTAILLRRSNSKVDRAMEIWSDHVMRHSRRDQLSVNYALERANLSINAINVDNMQSDIHEWIRADALPKRKEVLFSRSYKYSLAEHIRDATMTNRIAIAARTRTLRLSQRLRRP